MINIRPFSYADSSVKMYKLDFKINNFQRIWLKYLAKNLKLV